MAEFAATVAPSLVSRLDFASHPPVEQGGNAYLISNAISGGTHASGAGGIVLPLNDHAVYEAQVASLGFHWFEKVHLVPKTSASSPLEFGNIGGIVERDYELFNAYRKQSVTLTNVQNNATPGMDTPDVVAPDVLPPLVSFLDPSSTFNTSGTSLGTLVHTVARASAQGLPTFDTTIVFTFSPGGDLTLYITGDRIALISAEPELPVEEILGFATDIIEPLDGGPEQRICIRKRPRQKFALNYVLDGTERQRMQAMLFGWQPAVFAIPLWHEAIQLAANAAALATTVTTGSTADTDFRVGGLAVVYETATKFDVVQVTAVGATSISFTGSPLIFSYTAGHPVRVMPVRLAVLENNPSHSRPPVNAEFFTLQFRVTDNDTGAVTGSTSGWNTYLGKVLLDDCNIATDNSGEMRQRVSVIDNETGLVHTDTRWAFHHRSHIKGFRAGTRAEILKLRKLLMAFNGKQKSFYIPTFHDDLTVQVALTIGSNLMRIEHIGYGRFIDAREPKKTFRITFTDGTSLVRVIQSSSEIDADTEELTLDTTWPANRALNTIRRVEFYEKVRFDTDEFRLEYPRVGLARLFAPVKVVDE